MPISCKSSQKKCKYYNTDKFSSTGCIHHTRNGKQHSYPHLWAVRLVLNVFFLHSPCSALDFIIQFSVYSQPHLAFTCSGITYLTIYLRLSDIFMAFYCRFLIFLIIFLFHFLIIQANDNLYDLFLWYCTHFFRGKQYVEFFCCWVCFVPSLKSCMS